MTSPATSGRHLLKFEKTAEKAASDCSGSNFRGAAFCLAQPIGGLLVDCSIDYGNILMRRFDRNEMSNETWPYIDKLIFVNRDQIQPIIAVSHTMARMSWRPSVDGKLARARAQMTDAFANTNGHCHGPLSSAMLSSGWPVNHVSRMFIFVQYICSHLTHLYGKA